MRTIAILFATLILAASTATAQERKGWDTTTTTVETSEITQGNSGKPANPNASSSNQGTSTTTTTTTTETYGPKGQGGSNNPHVVDSAPSENISLSGPGKSNK